MIPKSLSASSVHVAELCMARWEAEMYVRGGGIAKSAAMLGTTVHGALEMYVTECILKNTYPATEKTLLEFFNIMWMTTFGSDTTTQPEDGDHADGVDMLKRWHKRTDFSQFTVLTCEVKENFEVKTSAGPIPFNYIWDRHDQLGPDSYRVVDYKTNAWGINPTDLREKIQARAYALAAQIKYPNAKEIWVEFDMLRHEGPVGIIFTRDENIATWNYIKKIAEEIILTPEGKPEEHETLNNECNFCHRKGNCLALGKNWVVGGTASMSIEQMIDARARAEYQRKALTSLIGELDPAIMAVAKERDVFTLDSPLNQINITASSRRTVDADRVSLVIGPELFDRYGGKSITLKNVDALLKGDQLTDNQKAQLRSLISSTMGEPRVTVKSKSDIDGD
ncbi:MAG TPA: PD-(D/E)XK nuclease family protein [Candidatus Paceibacterota bacterium]